MACPIAIRRDSSRSAGLAGSATLKNAASIDGDRVSGSVRDRRFCWRFRSAPSARTFGPYLPPARRPDAFDREIRSLAGRDRNCY